MYSITIWRSIFFHFMLKHENQNKFTIYKFIGKLDICHVMCATDKVWITAQTLIHKNIRSVRNLHVQLYQLIWCKIIMTSPI